jgi:hypothetical protein
MFSVWVMCVALWLVVGVSGASATPAYNTMSDAGNITAVILLVIGAIVTVLGLLGRYARQKKEWASAGSAAAS